MSLLCFLIACVLAISILWWLATAIGESPHKTDRLKDAGREASKTTKTTKFK